jgi:phage terminase small subunit
MSKSSSSLPSLTLRQIAYCNARAEGLPKSASYLKAGFSAPNTTQAGSSACKLEKDPRIASYISTLREAAFKDVALSFSEKRAFLARAVRTSVDQVGASSDLAQEVVEEVDTSGNVKRKIKVVDKLRALELDNKMSGDNFADRQPQVSNPFTLIIALGKTAGNTSLMDDARQAASVGQLPHPPLVMDAEVVPNDATT